MTSSDELKIDSAALDDIEDIRKVGRSAWWDTYSELMSRQTIEDSLSRWWSERYLETTISSSKHITLVARWNERIIGYTESEVIDNNKARALAIDTGNPHQAVLWKVYVLSEFRSRGIGTSLISRTLQLLPDTINNNFVEYVEGNESAERFYKRRGFEYHHSEKSEKENSIAHIWMVRDLTDS